MDEYSHPFMSRGDDHACVSGDAESTKQANITVGDPACGLDYDINIFAAEVWGYQSLREEFDIVVSCQSIFPVLCTTTLEIIKMLRKIFGKKKNKSKSCMVAVLVELIEE